MTYYNAGDFVCTLPNIKLDTTTSLAEPTLPLVAVLCLLAHDVEHGVDELGSLNVVALGPVVFGPRLAQDEVLGGGRCGHRSPSSRSPRCRAPGAQIVWKRPHCSRRWRARARSESPPQRPVACREFCTSATRLGDSEAMERRRRRRGEERERKAQNEDGVRVWTEWRGISNWTAG